MDTKNIKIVINVSDEELELTLIEALQLRKDLNALFEFEGGEDEDEAFVIRKIISPEPTRPIEYWPYLNPFKTAPGNSCAITQGKSNTSD